MTGSQLPEAAVDRASAFRGLLQFLYFGLERTLGSADPARPVLSRPWPVMSADRVGRELEALGTWLVETVRILAGAQARGISQFANQWDPHVTRPAGRVVALDDLDAALPTGTVRVTPAQRRRALDERLRQVTRLQRS